MATFRICKDKENPYVMVNKEWVYDSRMSAKAAGILLYLLSRPDDWQVYEEEIVKNFSDGKDSINSGVKELIKLGYIVRTRKRDKKGRMQGYNYDVYEHPTITEESVSGKPDDGKSHLGKPATTNNDLTDNDLTKYKNHSVSRKPSEKEKKEKRMKREIEELQTIIDNSGIEDVIIDHHELIKSTIEALYFYGIDNIPQPVIRAKLTYLNDSILRLSLMKYDFAKEDREIENPFKYFKKILWMCIYEYSINSFEESDV